MAGLAALWRGSGIRTGQREDPRYAETYGERTGPGLHQEEIFTNATAPEGDQVAMPRAMAVFAHPDDETIALGARLGRFAAAHLVHATDGAPRNEQDSAAHGFASWREYRDARAEELAAALREAGVEEMSRECLGVADQEASLRMVELTERLAAMMAERRPEVVFTHPYEGGHPDHDACAFAVHHATKRLQRESREAPLIIEAAFYHAGPSGMVAGEFLQTEHKTRGVAYALTEAEQRRKRAVLGCFRSQQETLRAFGVEWERFRVAPEYDFTRPPQQGAVLYDGFPWGMNSGRFCELARQAEKALTAEMAGACR